MPGNDFTAVGEGEHSALHTKDMRKVAKEADAKGLEVFEVGLAHFAEQQTLETGPALAIVGAHLREQPVTLAPATRTAIANGDGSIGRVAPARRRARCKLARLK